MNENQQQQIVVAQAKRDELCEQCFRLLHKISRKPSCLKLLGLAKTHLEMLAAYKTDRPKP